MSQGFNISRLLVRVPEGQEENLKVSGRLLYVEDANQGFRITTDSGDRAHMIAGRKIELGETTNNIRVTNDGVGDLVCTLAYGYGDIQDSAVTGSVSIKNAKQLNPMAPVTLADGEVYTIPANDTRQKLTLYAAVDNGGVVWLAGEKGKGLPLLGGHAHDLTEFSGAVSVCADGTGTQTLYLMEVSD
ncbi:hypothetical protein [Kistimonas asteriae]|uniref:hypothetical protein n=1 Tax=Kistimonas asteriae TaxID=517724 RepID=UPI001BAD4BED|nr:hypothetical protein [Kistimonas asteriae]